MSGDEPELEGPKGFRSRFSVGMVAPSQIIGAGAWVPVQFVAEDFDTLDEFDSVVTYVFQPRRAGFYLLCAHVTLFNCTNGTEIGIAFNDLTFGLIHMASEIYHAPVSDSHTLTLCAVEHLTPVQQIRVDAISYGGAASAVKFNPSVTRFMGHRLS